jgi:diguanylate cyclase (GGDEF)-like protein/PAS domain S-box-containing protein
MVVGDAHADPRFHDNPLVVGDPNIRFYAGAPLRTAEGHALGALCVIDTRPRQLTDTQRELLAELGSLVMEQLEHRRQRLLAERETEQLRTLLAALPAPVTVHRGSEVVFANAAAEKVLRVGPGGLVGQSAGQFVVPGSQTERSTPRRLESTVRISDGNEVLVESTLMPLRWRGDEAWVALHRDVGAERQREADRQRATDSLARELNQLLVIFDGLPEGVIVADASRRCVYANRMMTHFFGVTTADLLGWTLEDIARHVSTCSDDPERTARRMREMVEIPEGTSRAEKFTFVTPRGQVLRREVHRLGLPERPWVNVWTDISAEAAELKQSQLAASTDPLTGLANRRAAEAELRRALSAGGPVSVVLFDVDHFKKVNDTFGHDVGDAVLVAVAGALRGRARAGDFVARWGGEEFLAVVAADEAGARRLAERARVAVSELETGAGRVTVSAGVARVEQIADVKRADERLYEAKHQGRNRVVG